MTCACAYGYHSGCLRCDRRWCEVDGHVTNYTERRGCFPLCEECWLSLTPLERAPYYEALWRLWKDTAGVRPVSVEDLRAMLEAVRAGG